MHRLWSGPLVVSLLGALGFVACSRDHDLGISGSASSSSSSSGSGGSGGGTGGTGGSPLFGGAGGVGGSGAAGGGSVTSTSASTGGTGGTGGGGVDAGPQGPTELTIVNGVNDYEAIRICFLPHPGGDPTATPWPPSALGMSFASSMVVDPISSAVPMGTDVRPWIIAGDLAQAAGKTCAQILAMAGGDAGSPLIATPLAVLPAAVFDSHKSVLLVPAGCLGGPGHSAGGATLGCGNSYSIVNPTPSLAVVGMSRLTDPNKVSFQYVDASVAMPESDVWMTPGYDGSVDSLLGNAITFGSIEPSPPFKQFSLNDLGPVSKVAVKTFQPNTTFSTSTVLMSEIFAAGGAIGESDFVNGAGIVMVAVGAYPGVAAGPFWHKLTYVLVKADPGP